MAQNKYSSDVFFEPWVGQYYKYGIKLVNGEIKFGEKDDDGLKVMILGCDHYCKTPEKVEGCISENNKLYPNNKEICDMHHGSKNCGQLTYCREFTKRVIEKWKTKSHQKFEKTFYGKEDKEIWKYLIFSNFFQRSMPYEGDTKNINYMTSEKEQKRGTEAFIDIVKNNEPKIIITWGTENSNIWKYGLEPGGETWDKKNTPKKLFRRTKFKKGGRNLPRIKITWQVNQGTKSAEAPFTIMDYKGKDNQAHHCLILCIKHPSRACPGKFCDKDYYEKWSKIILCAFKYHNEFIKWDNNATFYNGKPITEPPVCKIKWDETSKSFNWTNQSDFPK